MGGMKLLIFAFNIFNVQLILFEFAINKTKIKIQALIKPSNYVLPNYNSMSQMLNNFLSSSHFWHHNSSLCENSNSGVDKNEVINIVECERLVNQTWRDLFGALKIFIIYTRVRDKKVYFLSHKHAITTVGNEGTTGLSCDVNFQSLFLWLPHDKSR